MYIMHTLLEVNAILLLHICRLLEETKERRMGVERIGGSSLALQLEVGVGMCVCGGVVFPLLLHTYHTCTQH